MEEREVKKQKRRDFIRWNRYEIDDRFVISDGKKHKCAIICPGGGYGAVCSYVEGVPIAKELNKLGISALIVYYRVRRKAKYPNPQDDLARAVKEIHAKSEEYHLDMEDYSVWGFSAGGHLVGSFGTKRMGYRKYNLNKPGALILGYPVISLEREVTHMGTKNNLIGEKSTVEEERAYSIHTNVDNEYPKTFIFCGDADTTVSMENTELMLEALEKHDVPFVGYIFEDVEHGVGVGTGTAASGWIKEAVRFWTED